MAHAAGAAPSPTAPNRAHTERQRARKRRTDEHASRGHRAIVVSDSPWGEGKKLIHIGIKGYALRVRQYPDVNLVLLLDVSGSMNAPDKLPLAQRSMALLLDTLKPTDTVAIVVYAGAAGEVLPPTPLGSNAQLIDERRYAGAPADAKGKSGEYGFLKIRYKLPDSSRSRLIEQPILMEARARVLSEAQSA